MFGDEPYVPFSQREGYAKLPEQLKLGEVSDDLRRLLDYYFGLEIERECFSNYNGEYFNDDWKRVVRDFYVLFLGKRASEFNSRPYEFRKFVEEFTKRADISQLFDFVEFFSRHSKCSAELRRDLAGSFVAARAAYRLIDGQIVAIGTEQQAAAFEAAVNAADVAGAIAARKHLLASGLALRDENWADCIRESIHAVEAMALSLAPGTKTLSPALSKLEQGGHLHGALKAAFNSLYGYSSDEEGVRHALVFNKEAQVDEADALFMLGACASFVSFLIARSSMR